MHAVTERERPLVENRTASLMERLELGEVIHFPECPFAFLDEEDNEFLLEQRLSNSLHKNISYAADTHNLTGALLRSREQRQRLESLLARFSERADMWLADQLPRYASDCRRERVSLSPAEEATRPLRHTARNDLLHIDAFPTRPTRGRRILRLFVNVSLSEPRIWVTSERFPKLLSRYGTRAGLPADLRSTWWTKLRRSVFGAFDAKQRSSTPYDEFMHRFHNFLKLNDEFQEKSAKRLWSFAPGSAWLFFTDYVSYANLRGRFLLDQTFLVAPQTLLLPQQAPLELLRHACRRTTVEAVGTPHAG